MIIRTFAMSVSSRASSQCLNRLVFFCLYAMAKRNFRKDYKTPQELVTLLENRGLIINDRLGKMHELFCKFPEIDLAALGFPVGWEQEPIWIQANSKIL